MRGKQGTIQLAKREEIEEFEGTRGWKVVKIDCPALLFGSYLAIHKPIDTGGWAITHVPTGFRILTRDTQRECRTIIEEGLIALDWNFSDPRQIPDATREAVRKYYSWKGQHYIP